MQKQLPMQKVSSYQKASSSPEGFEASNLFVRGTLGCRVEEADESSEDCSATRRELQSRMVHTVICQGLVTQKNAPPRGIHVE